MRWRNRTWILTKIQEALGGEENGQLDTGHDAETIANWAEAALERGPVLFVGAGWTRNAIAKARIQGVQGQIPEAFLWPDFARRFRSALGHDGHGNDTDPLWLAELYRQRYGEDALMRVVREGVPDDQLEPGPLHRALVQIPWRAILTVNYDTLVERAFAEHQRVRVCVDDSDLVASSTRDGIEVIHLHGVLTRPKTIVLAFEDYRLYPQTHPGLLAKVRQLFLQHPVLFVGFSVTDPNFLQWSGWVHDITTGGGNPWLNLTLDPPPSLSHSRFWGSRLSFVSVRPFGRFKEAVPKLFDVLGEAMGTVDDRQEDVARTRILATKTARDAVAEARALLDTWSERHGDDPIDRGFLGTVLDGTASHVLDLKHVPWRTRKPDPAEADRPPRIEIDLRPPELHEGDRSLVEQLRLAFDESWPDWLKVVGAIAGKDWVFRRINLTNNRPPNPADNTTRVPLPQPPEQRPAEEGTSPDDRARIALREGGIVEAPLHPQSAQEWRLCGYLRCQFNDAGEAAQCYEKAALASRSEYEPLRTEWLTMWSERVPRNSLRMVAEESAEQRLARNELQSRWKRATAELNRLPYEEGAGPIHQDEVRAERKLVELLVADLVRVDVDRMQRFGDVYGAAQRQFERLESRWMAPGLIAPAADVLGTLQWRFEERTLACRTLARYGSKRLKDLVAATIRDTDQRLEGGPALADELLRHGRWPGEWLARVEALEEILPACRPDQIERVGRYVCAARDALKDRGGVARGSHIQARWSAIETVEALEYSRWEWLAPSDVVEAVERWLPELAETKHSCSAAASELCELPWGNWLKQGIVEVDRVLGISVRLIALASSQRGSAESTLEFFHALGRAIPDAPDRMAPLREQVEKVIELMENGRRAPMRARFALLFQDEDGLRVMIDDAIRSFDPANDGSWRALLLLLATARRYPETHRAVVVSILRTAIESASNASAQLEPQTFQAIDDARLAGFAMGRFLSSNCDSEPSALIELSKQLVSVAPMASQFLVGVPTSELGDAEGPVRNGVADCLEGRGPTGPLSLRQWRLFGLNGVARLSHARPEEVPAEWLALASGLIALPDPYLAQYATSVLSDWTSRAKELPSAHRVIVESALVAAARDARAPIRAASVAGLTALCSECASQRAASVLDELRRDGRVAVVRALDRDNPEARKPSPQ